MVLFIMLTTMRMTTSSSFTVADQSIQQQLLITTALTLDHSLYVQLRA